MAENAQQQEAQVQTLEGQETSLLDQILTEGKMARDDFQKERAKDVIAEFVGQVMHGELKLTKDMDSAINARIAEIDRLITSQLNEVMHHEEFQKLEAKHFKTFRTIKSEVQSINRVALSVDCVIFGFDENKLKAFAKTSGKTGIHLYLPCEGFSFPEARSIAEHICNEVHLLVPEITTTEVTISKRGNKLSIDPN